MAMNSDVGIPVGVHMCVCTCVRFHADLAVCTHGVGAKWIWLQAQEKVRSGPKVRCGRVSWTCEVLYWLWAGAALGWLAPGWAGLGWRSLLVWFNPSAH